jgi:short-subunit dehydrogenase
MEICELKNIMVTGCGSGLGESLVKKSVHYPVSIFPHYRNASKNFEDGCIYGDINNPDFLNILSEKLEQYDIDVFVNNAAVYSNGSLIDISDDEIKNTITTNLISQILLLKRAYSYFLKKKSGMIININSLAGINPSKNESIYCASKFGLQGFSKSLQLESIDSKIEIVDIFPGAMKTRMTQGRKNYNCLMDAKSVADTIYNIVLNNNHLVNEVVIRRKK